MGRSVFIVQHMIFGIFILAGSILFLSFCWPAVFKGMINTGNVCGMAASVLLVLYGIFHKSVHQLAGRLWELKMGRICLCVLLVLTAAALVLMAAAAAVIVRSASNAIPQNTPAVVLGCSVKGTKPSTILQERIDAAYDYMTENPQASAVLSGGRGRGEDISEAECMYQNLIKKGIDAGRLYKEDQSVNTRENLEYSKEILDQLDSSGSAAVISSEFHLYRGRKQAEALGLKSYGFAAKTDWKYLPTYFLREIIAVVHLWLTSG